MSDKKKYTPEQIKAMETYGKNIIVSAGAGSGKTEVLGERVKYFITEYKDNNGNGFKIDEFLILTFTRLASAEMKARIKNKLIEAGSPEASLVDTANICNFDSYALKLCQKYHYKLGLSPNLSIIDTNIIMTIRYRFEEEILEEYYQNHNETLNKLVEIMCFKTDDKIYDIINKIYNVVVNEVDPDEFINNYMTNYYSDEFVNSIYQKAIDKIYKYIDRINNYIDKLPTIKDYQDVVRNELAPLNNIKDISELLSFVLQTKLPSKPKKAFNESEDKLHESFKNLFKSFKEYCNEFPIDIVSLKDNILANKEYSEFFIEIIKKLMVKLNDYKNHYNVYEFSDISAKALKLLKENDNIRNEIKNNLKMIMVDEYQDTSAIQEEFINLIADNNLYMVGDIKQSIYRFRNARCEIFKNKYEKYQAGIDGISIDMNTNFRSRQEVLEDINDIFSGLMSLEVGGANYQKDHLIRFGNKKFDVFKNSKEDYHLEFLQYELDDDMVVSEQEACIVASDIINKINNHYQVYDKDLNSLRDVRLSDFCILMDRGLAFNNYKKVFNKYKIPLYIEQDEDIKSNTIILVVRNIIQLLSCIEINDYSSTTFKRSFVSVARSFIFDYSDDKIYNLIKKTKIDKEALKEEEIIKYLRDFVVSHNDYSLSLMLKELLFDLKIHEKIILIGDVAKNESYLDVIIELFDSVINLDYQYEDFIHYLDNINDYNLQIKLPSVRSEFDSVRIMNIHKSKGLEFKIVYFSGLYKEFNPADSVSKNNFARNFGLYLDIDNNKLIASLAKDELISEDLSEKIRLFYVALTRTVEKMIFIYQKDDKQIEEVSKIKSFSHIISYLRLQDRYKVKEGIINNIKLPDNKLDKTNLNISELEYDPILKETGHASKALSLDVKKNNLELGTRLHFILEIMDFKNPNYDILNGNDLELFKKFISSPLVKNVKEGNIYKEHRFFDEDENVRGIIDLMIEYNDHIDIIDYKTSHIEDEAYDIQLNIYRRYIKRMFNKPVNCYLYSIVTGKYREVEEE